MGDTNKDINFCIKYYPQLYNVSESAENATKYEMEDIVFLNESENLCDSDTFSVHQIKDKLVVSRVWPSTQNSSKNCSVDEQAQVVHDLGGKGLILQSSNFNSNFSLSSYSENDTIVV